MARPRKRISVREALRLRKRVRELEARLNDVLNEAYPGAVVSRIGTTEVLRAEIATAQRLGFALVARYDGADVRFHAVRKEF